MTLQHAVDAVRATVAIAAKHGATSARISLAPPSLGSIRIRLTRTDEGLIARVVAEHPDAAKALLQNGGELRRSLEAAGLPLLRLDIEASDQGGGQSAGTGHGASTHQSGGTGEEPAADADPSDAAETPVELSDGSLVNVLA